MFHRSLRRHGGDARESQWFSKLINIRTYPLVMSK
jgi:hypothetical protein